VKRGVEMFNSVFVETSVCSKNNFIGRKETQFKEKIDGAQA